MSQQPVVHYRVGQTYERTYDAASGGWKAVHIVMCRTGGVDGNAAHARVTAVPELVTCPACCARLVELCKALLVERALR